MQPWAQLLLLRDWPSQWVKGGHGSRLGPLNMMKINTSRSQRPCWSFGRISEPMMVSLDCSTKMLQHRSIGLPAQTPGGQIQRNIKRQPKRIIALQTLQRKKRCKFLCLSFEVFFNHSLGMKKISHREVYGFVWFWEEDATMMIWSPCYNMVIITWQDDENRCQGRYAKGIFMVFMVKSISW